MAWEQGFNLKVKMRAYLPIKLKLLHCSQSQLPSLLHFGMKWAPFPELLLHSFSSLSQGDDYFSHCSHVKEMQKTRDIFQLGFVEVIYFFLFGLFILGTFIFCPFPGYPEKLLGHLNMSWQPYCTWKEYLNFKILKKYPCLLCKCGKFMSLQSLLSWPLLFPPETFLTNSSNLLS